LVRLLKRIGYRLVLSHAIRSSRRILVPTQFVADDVRHFYPNSSSKIVVTGEGMAVVSIPTTYKLTPNSYLLYVGSAYPHKGLTDLVDAWPSISRDHPELTLKIAGSEDAFMKRLKQDVVQHKLERVHFLGYVDDAELDELYRHAIAFVYPSHFEGFGLPPLEA